MSKATNGHRRLKDVWMSHTHGGFPLRLIQTSYPFLVIVLTTVIIISVTLPFENFDQRESWNHYDSEFQFCVYCRKKCLGGWVCRVGVGRMLA